IALGNVLIRGNEADIRSQRPSVPLGKGSAMISPALHKAAPADRPGSQRTARAQRRFRPRVEQLEERFLPAVSLLQNFASINFNQSGFYTPPDTMMAVGPTSVVAAVNVGITLTNK